MGYLDDGGRQQERQGNGQARPRGMESCSASHCQPPHEGTLVHHAQQHTGKARNPSATQAKGVLIGVWHDCLWIK